jgi:L-alanine-DL-glutamate epimerase-like enolase superfamily enzyme
MNRRHFIAASAAAIAGAGILGKATAQETSTTASATAGTAAGKAVGAGPAARISRIDIFPVNYPMAGYFKFFHGAKGSQGRAAVIIKITSDSGHVGWGQSVPIPKWSYETLETATVTLLHYFIPELIGRDPLDIEGALAALDKVIAPSFTTGMPITRAGIDIALHDLSGKIQGKSLPELWGKPAGEKLTLSWTVNVTKLDDVSKVMAEGRDRGYQNFNIKVGPDPEFDVALAKAVRAGAPDGFLWSDANCGYEPEVALKAAPLLAKAGVDILEAPVRPNQISTYQALKKQGALPILMDEGVVSPVELEEFIKLGMLDGMAMKPARCGGLLSNKKQIELCEEHKLMWVGSGLTDPDIALTGMIQLYGAYGLKKPAALNGPQFLVGDVLKMPIKVENGEMTIPSGTGLGIEVDEGKVAELMKSSGGDKLLEALA